MLTLVRSYYELLLMRLPPQAFPASSGLFGIVLAAFAVVALTNNFLMSGEAGYALAHAGISIVNICAGTAIILFIARRLPRWQQTATALLGGTALLGAMLLPVLIVYVAGIQNIFIYLSMLAFNVWNLIFFAHVYRNALDTGMGAGIAVALIYLIASLFIKATLAPFPGTG
jgi:hypothetical protein